tara:strand:- start:1720 stop:2634 length:915 start_codon:yes stop_codon:yes gene_type:complete
MESRSIIFMGTPDFAVYCLDKIIKEKIVVKGIITAPDRNRGRGRKTNVSPVKDYAIKNKIPIFQPTNLKDQNFQKEIKKLNVDLFVVVAFRMLPESLINIPKLGSINLHASYLPNYRGAAPINWVIINGEKETGISVFFLNKKIDEGDIIKQKKVKINKYEKADELHDRLMNAGSNLLTESIIDIFKNTYKTKKQKINSSDIKAPKITKSICLLSKNEKAEKIINKIHGLSHYPGAFINHKNKSFKIFSARPHKFVNNIGSSFFIYNKKILLNNSMEETVEILEIQAEGKRKMNSKEFIKGNKL